MNSTAAFRRLCCSRFRPADRYLLLPRNHPETLGEVLVRHSQHEAAVGLKTEQSPRDEFELIQELNRKKLEKPKKDRRPFIKNLFLKRIDPTILEFPELQLGDFNDLMMHVEPVEKRVKQVDPRLVDQQGTIPEDCIADLKNFGAFVYRIPRLYNGNELDHVGYARMVEALSAKGNLALGALGYVSGSWCAKIVEECGTEEQKSFYLPQIASGAVSFSLSVAEAQSGADMAAMKCWVRLGPDNRGYIINGKKSWVINAPKADYFLVIAKHEGVGADTTSMDPEKQFEADRARKGSMSAFVVSKKAPGVSVGKQVPFMGLRGLQTAEVIFDDVAISLDSLLGAVGGGFAIAMKAVADERHVLGSIALPLLKKLISDATEHVVHRKIFNRQMSDFHMIQEKLVESTCFTYALESMVYLTALLNDTTINPEFDMESAAVRIFAADIVPRCIVNIMSIYGATGLTLEKDFEMILRDALTLFEIDGGTDIARLYLSLSGLQYAGMVNKEIIQKENHPFSHPDYHMNGFLARLRSKTVKRTVFLEDFIHPSFTTIAQELELSIMNATEAVTQMLTRHHKNLVHQQMNLRRVSEIMTLIYGCFAVLGRASRSYCTGLRNNQHEVALATIFCQQTERRLNAICAELNSEFKATDEFINEAMTVLAKNKGYCCEHPLARNF